MEKLHRHNLLRIATMALDIKRLVFLGYLRVSAFIHTHIPVWDVFFIVFILKSF